MLRDEEEYTFTVTTGELGELQGEDYECPDWGFTVKDITRQMQISNQLRDSLGVLVVGVKRVGAADMGGLRRNDVVRQINKEPVNDLAEFAARYTELTARKEPKVLLTVGRNGATRLVVINTEKELTTEETLLDE